MTQHITRANEWDWQMKDDDHRLWSGPEYGKAELKVSKYCDGSVEIHVTETGLKEKNILMHLKSDIVRSLLEWLGPSAQEPANNNGAEQAPATPLGAA
jgi:hypothetical protein